MQNGHGIKYSHAHYLYLVTRSSIGMISVHKRYVSHDCPHWESMSIITSLTFYFGHEVPTEF